MSIPLCRETRDTTDRAGGKQRLLPAGYKLGLPAVITRRNLLRYNAEANLDLLEVSIYYRPLYLGV